MIRLSVLVVVVLCVFVSVEANRRCGKGKRSCVDFYAPHTPTVYDGQVATYRKKGRLGISFTPELIESLCTDDFSCGRTENFALKALNKKAGSDHWDHLGLDYNPFGHPPLFAWGVPHFDFHFYVVSEERRAEAVCPGFPPCLPEQDVSGLLFAPIPESSIPYDYHVDLSSAVPNMGIHVEWDLEPQLADVGDEIEWTTATLIYGFIGGELAFIEPMVTVALLQSKTSWYAPVNQPVVHPQDGYYPTGYRVYWSQRTGRHHVELTGLKFRKAGASGRPPRSRSDSDSGHGSGSSSSGHGSGSSSGSGKSRGRHSSSSH